jgi:hypothetical protein
MFLLHALAVFSVAYWISAAVGEAVLRSEGERSLSPGVRAGFGFFVVLAFFTAAWQFLPIGWAWLAGLVLLALYLLGVGLPPRAAWRGHLAAFGAFLCGAAVFFLPLLLAWTFGPFTEAGGDISIYADTAKYLVDRGLTQSGLAAPDLAGPMMDPPYADYATLRVVAVGTMSKFLYTPYAIFSFLAGETNYAVFHGVQALVYVFMAAACWDFFRRHGRALAMLATGFVVVSLGVAAVFYNTYSAQAISLGACALTLAALPHVRLPSWAGLRTYGCIGVVVWVTYVHYLGVLLPMLLAALARPRRAPWAPTRLPAALAAVAFLALLGSVAFDGARKSWEIARVLLGDALASGAGIGANQFMGEPLPLFGAKWLAFAFGVVSQQHIWPLSYEIGAVDLAMRAAVGAGVACVIAGLVVTARATATGRLHEARRLVAVYLLALATIALHLYLVRKSLYTQAKGAQNVLVLVYAAMALPIAFAAGIRQAARIDRAARGLLVATAVAFLALLLVPRAAYMLRFVGAFDRTSILEPSYFDEAARIRRADPNPLVLVEPRVSSDLYAAGQSFFGARMLPTRHIVLKTSGPHGKALPMTDFIKPEDLPHLWMLRPERERKWEWLGKLPYVAGFLPRPSYSTTWRAERLAERRQPLVIYSGDLYERVSERTTGTQAPPGFVTLRNASVSVFVPAHTAATVTVEMRPDAKMNATGDAPVLSHAIPAAPNPVLRVLAHCPDRCYARVQLDGKDIP